LEQAGRFNNQFDADLTDKYRVLPPNATLIIPKYSKHYDHDEDIPKTMNPLANILQGVECINQFQTRDKSVYTLTLDPLYPVHNIQRWNHSLRILETSFLPDLTMGRISSKR